MSPRSRVMFLLAVVAVAGCGHAKSPAADPAPDQTAPGPVALAYTTALLAGDLPRATPYVLPADRSTLAAVPLPPGLVVHTYGLAVGSAAVKDSTAVVVLLGKLCNVTPVGSAAPAPSPSAENCISNDDKNSTNPLFRVSLNRFTDQKWYVRFPGQPAPATSR